MFVAKPVLFILFILSIGSTSGLLYLLSQRSPSQPVSPTATNTVIVSPTSQATTVSAATTGASPSAQLSSSAEWKTATSSALSIRIEYPADWNLKGLDTDILEITAPSSTVVSIQRFKKQSSSSKLAQFTSIREQTYKKDSYTIKSDSSTSINDYSGNDRVYVKENESTREIVFATRNYFYVTTITPGEGDLTPVINDVVRSIRIQ